MSRRAGTALAVVWLVGLAGACTTDRGTLPANAAREGVAIAIYQLTDRKAYGVVDDRRWVDVAGGSLVLDRIDPRAALPSLVIEPLAGGALEIGACLRDRIPADATAKPALAPVLHCAVRAARGRHLVRVLYIVPQLGYRAQHDVAMTAPDRATVSSRFAIVTPAWQVRAEATLFDGMPGEDQPPRELVRGTIMLDGGIAVVAAPPRAIAARLRRAYDGAVQRTVEIAPRDPRWRRESHAAVWVWLELDDLALAPGPFRAHVAIPGEATHDIDVPARGRRQVAAGLQLPLWIDDRVRGKRDRRTEAQDDAMLIERLAVSIGNTGDATREVWIEETLRPSRSRTIRRAWPAAPTLVKNQLRLKLTVPPGRVERAGFEIVYEM